MNIVNCSENCRWQNDGICTLEDISRISSENSRCCHFERRS